MKAQEKWSGTICPKIKKKLQKNVEFANKYFEVLPAGRRIFSVRGREYTHIVDINARTCDCRRWQLSGIPCGHVIASFRLERMQPESMVTSSYHRDTFLQEYGTNVMPVGTSQGGHQYLGLPLPYCHVNMKRRWAGHQQGTERSIHLSLREDQSGVNMVEDHVWFEDQWMVTSWCDE
jgi:hypothetical protein